MSEFQTIVIPTDSPRPWEEADALATLLARMRLTRKYLRAVGSVRMHPEFARRVLEVLLNADVSLDENLAHPRGEWPLIQGSYEVASPGGEVLT